MGCHSSQNYVFTILGNLAVSLSNVLSGTVQLRETESGTANSEANSRLHATHSTHRTRLVHNVLDSSVSYVNLVC